MKRPSDFTRIVAGILIGVSSGISASIFLHLLAHATRFCNDHAGVIWFLPIAGFLTVWIYQKVGRRISQGTELIFEEIQNPKRHISLLLTPFILVGTLVTHLFGGSAGREGTAVQMGASLGDWLSVQFGVEVSSEERRRFLIAGAASGFGAALGAPWAGFIFGIEFTQRRGFCFLAWIECLIASFVAHLVTIALHAPHSIFPRPEILSLEWRTFFSVLIAGIVFGATARLYCYICGSVERIQCQLISYAPFRPFFAGILLALLFVWEGTYRFTGLGIGTIQGALTEPSSFGVPIAKLFFTALTVASGFKGGDFVPLVFVGTTLGSALSVFLPVSFGTLAVAGFAAVFGAAAKTPLACAILTAELFGFFGGAYALVACYCAYFISGTQGVWSSQAR